MGLFRKGIAALLAVCVVATSMGFGVQAQSTVQNEPDIEQGTEQEGINGDKGQEERDQEERKQETRDQERKQETRDQEERKQQETRDQEETGILNFLMMENDYVRTPSVQNIAVSLGQENLALERAELTYRKADDGQEFQVEAAKIADNMAKFTIEYTEDAQKGIYELLAIQYQAGGRLYEVTLSELGMDVHYGVNQETDTEPDEVLLDQDVLEEVEANVVTMDENGNTVSEESIGDVLQETEIMSRSMPSKGAARAVNKMVIVLDPGHDSTHAGARGNGCKEEEAVLKIAQYCKTELQKYAGITVYMTRTSNTCPNGGAAVTSSICNAKRVEFAVSKKADVYVSFHLNASVSTAASGVGVYIPNNNYRPQIGEEGKGLATSIYKKLSALGLKTWAGGVLIHNSEDNTRYPDGSLADYLGVIRRSKEAGIPAVLIEHAFLSNAADVSGFLNSNAKLKKLGVADAQGIAQYYGLTLRGNAPEIDWIQSRNSKKLRINWLGAMDAVSYQVYRSDPAEGKFKKIADVSGTQYDDGTVKEGVLYSYKVRAVLSEGGKSPYSAVQTGAVLTVPEIRSVVSKAAGKLKVSWKVSSGAAKYEVWRKEDGAAKYNRVATTTENSFTDSNIKTQQNYSYKIRARGGDKNGFSSYSPIRAGWAVMKTSVRNVSSVTGTSLRVRWKKVENAYRYRIQRSTSKKKGFKTIAEVRGTASSYVDKTVKAKKNYYYKVQVLNNVDGKIGSSGYCSPVAGQTITPTSLVYVKSNDSATMELKWRKDKDAYAYSIKRSTKKNGIYEKIAEIRDCKITNYQDKGITSGKRYYYVVETIIKKKGVKGYSGDSKPVSAYSLRKVNVDAIQKVANGFLLEWQEAPGANCYEILRSTQKSGGFTQIAKVQGKEAVSFTDQGIQKGMKYYYRIRAVHEGKRPGYGSYGKVAESIVY